MTRTITPLAVLVGSAFLCAGATLQYHETGVFSAFTPNTPYSAPNQPFDLTFLLDSDPVPAMVGPIAFSVPSVVSLSVGSRPLLVAPVEVQFSEEVVFGGGFGLVFGDFFLGWGGEQLFTGPLVDPVMRPGTFSLAGATLTVSAVPEPKPTGAIATALIGFLTVVRRQRIRSRTAT